MCTKSRTISAVVSAALPSRHGAGLDKHSGSTTIYPYNDTSIDPIELGASIFIPANKILWRATEEFGLKRIAFENKKGVTGIWNGQQFTLQMESGNFFREWWSTVKVLLRYGWSAPVNTKKLFVDVSLSFNPKI